MKINGYIPLNLRFFDDSAAGEKTEQPTQRKKEKARDEGQVVKSQEVSTAFLFLAAFFSLRLFGGGIFNNLLGLFNFEIRYMLDTDQLIEQVFIANHVAFLFQRIILFVLPIFAVVLVVGIITNLVQVGWKVTGKPLQPKFNKLNPLSGFKRIFSMELLANFVKSMLKFVAVGAVIFTMIKDEINFIPNLLYMTLEEVVVHIGNLIVDLGLTVGLLFLFIAAADYAYTWYKQNKKLKMSKQEVKEEWKQTEGNPQIKQKIKQKMREVSMRRMMQNVPKADVIITNPTHYAVALQYDRFNEAGGAPVLVAKGVDYLAKRIRDAARDNDIVVVENPPLARTIYDTVQLNQEIPPELYAAVAEILAYVFRLKNAA
ncbi:MAG: flagellar biosynthesis protein FlhB [Defluviitaleaceae bacterium]|nr:flagellar biosynthesis protein FlhB [Defluviitaleaceae bacterium]